ISDGAWLALAGRPVRDRLPGLLQHDQRDLPLAHDHDIRAKLRQMLDLGIEMRASDDLEAWIGPPGLLNDLAGFESVRDGDEQDSRLLEVGRRASCAALPEIASIDRARRRSTASRDSSITKRGDPAATSPSHASGQPGRSRPARHAARGW